MEKEEEVNLSTGGGVGGFRLEISRGRGALWLFGSISGSWTRDRPCFLFILDRVRPTPRRS